MGTARQNPRKEKSNVENFHHQNRSRSPKNSIVLFNYCVNLRIFHLIIFILCTPSFERLRTSVPLYIRPSHPQCKTCYRIRCILVVYDSAGAPKVSNAIVYPLTTISMSLILIFNILQLTIWVYHLNATLIRHIQNDNEYIFNFTASCPEYSKLLILFFDFKMLYSTIYDTDNYIHLFLLNIICYK